VLLKKKIVLSLLLILIFKLVVTTNGFAQAKNTGWSGIVNNIPQWFEDAKFGIYFHLGPYTVPAFGSEWYSRNMYIPGTPEYKHHLETYGPLDKFGYKDFIPLFKAEYFNPDDWVDLFVKAGAKFAGPVAEHADGFSMWKSKINPWNSYDMGPKRDFVGEMEKAVRKRNLKFIATFHHQWLWSWYPTFNKNVDAGDPEYASFYGPRVSEGAWKYDQKAIDYRKPTTAFDKIWLAKTLEVIDAYHPDIIWFDNMLYSIPDSYRKEFTLHYLNDAKTAQHQVVIIRKFKELPDAVSIENLEKARKDKMAKKLWETDETISTGSWSYVDGIQIRSTADMLFELIDIVSKNGVLLLDIAPKADGTIPEDQRNTLLGMGDWLKKYGESIYATRPWYTYGEGPTIQPEGDFANADKFLKVKYSYKDIRFTTKGNIIYAITLGVPVEGETMLLTAFTKSEKLGKIKIKTIEILGLDQNLKWKLADNGLSVTIPGGLPDNKAIVFRINMD
jgi:alpha-L-fucosidase